MIKFAVATRQGTRPHNGDAAAVRRLGGTTAAALVDGVGGIDDHVI